MKINMLSIAGVDDPVDQEVIQTISDMFDFVEWGILFSKSRAGESRYPSTEYLTELGKRNLNLSAHFCGWWVREVIENKNMDLITTLPPNYNRVQFNYSFKKDIDLTHIKEYAITYPNRALILPLNKTNSIVLNDFKNQDLPDNIHFLYDSSGGRGTEIKEFQNPVTGHYTGYAGGLNPDNIDDACVSLAQIKEDANVWLDLESGARTFDRFDVGKAILLLNKTEPWINSF